VNKTLATRMKKLEATGLGGDINAIIVYAKWNELNEDAVRRSFIGPPPTDIPIYVFTEEMTTEQWLERFGPNRKGDDYWKDRGGSFCIFAGMHEAKRIRVAAQRMIDS
jgi:hypothetical protein